jgi:hypothetical protein
MKLKSWLVRLFRRDDETPDEQTEQLERWKEQEHQKAADALALHSRYRH